MPSKKRTFIIRAGQVSANLLTREINLGLANSEFEKERHNQLNEIIQLAAHPLGPIRDPELFLQT